MISRDLVLSIADRSVALDKSLTLYRFDRGITLNIELKSDILLLDGTEITKARAIIRKPDKSITATEIEDIVDKTYVLYLDNTWTDGLDEVGTYSIQLQLYSDDSDNECITVAPFDFEVKAPIGIPSNSPAYVDKATVGNYSAQASNDVPTGDLANGEYLKTNWITNDLITSGKLNKIENTLYFLVENAAEEESSFSGSYDDLTNKPDLTIYITSEALEEALDTKADTIHTHDQYLTEHQSLEGYALKSEIPDVSGFITEIPEEYVTESELNTILNGLKLWYGTQEEYDAIETKDPSTLYFIKED